MQFVAASTAQGANDHIDRLAQDIAASYYFRQYLCSEEGTGVLFDADEAFGDRPIPKRAGDKFALKKIQIADPDDIDKMDDFTLHTMKVDGSTVNLKGWVMARAHQICRKERDQEDFCFPPFRFSHSPVLINEDRQLLSTTCRTLAFYNEQKEMQDRVASLIGARAVQLTAGVPLIVQPDPVAEQFMTGIEELADTMISALQALAPDLAIEAQSIYRKYYGGFGKLVTCSQDGITGHNRVENWHPDLLEPLDPVAALQDLDAALNADMQSMFHPEDDSRDPIDLIDTPQHDLVLGMAKAMFALILVSYESCETFRDPSTRKIDAERFRLSGRSDELHEPPAFGEALLQGNLAVLGQMRAVYESDIPLAAMDQMFEQLCMLAATALVSRRFWLWNLVFARVPDLWATQLQEQGLSNKTTLGMLFGLCQFAEGVFHSCTIGARLCRIRTTKDANQSVKNWLEHWVGTGARCAIPACDVPLAVPDVQDGKNLFRGVPLGQRLAVGVLVRRSPLKLLEVNEGFARKDCMPCLVTPLYRSYHPTALPTQIGFACLMHHSCRAQRGKLRRGGGRSEATAQK